MARLLIVEDDDDVRKVLHRYLRSQAHEVLEAANGEQALTIFGESRPDVALVDLNLPGIPGTQVIRHFQTHHPATRVVAISAVEQALSAVVQQLGITHVLSKPFQLAELDAVLEATLGADRDS